MARLFTFPLFLGIFAVSLGCLLCVVCCVSDLRYGVGFLELSEEMGSLLDLLRDEFFEGCASHGCALKMRQKYFVLPGRTSEPIQSRPQEYILLSINDGSQHSPLSRLDQARESIAMYR